MNTDSFGGSYLPCASFFTSIQSLQHKVTLNFCTTAYYKFKDLGCISYFPELFNRLAIFMFSTDGLSDFPDIIIKTRRSCWQALNAHIICIAFSHIYDETDKNIWSFNLLLHSSTC